MVRAVAALAADAQVAEISGGVYASWELAKEYGFADIDGRTPGWWGYVRASIDEILARGGPKDEGETYWVDAWRSQLGSHLRFSDRCRRIDAARRQR